MPALSNPKHEIFAQEFAQGKTADEAYALAGYRKSRSNASVLRTNQNIADRVIELQRVVAAQTESTIESLIREADQIQRAAMVTGQYSAAISALTSKAKLAGLWGEKRENTNRSELDAMTDAELRELIRRELALDGGSEDLADGSGSPAPIRAWRQKVA
jgi:phage terminase small subunit